MGRLLPLTAALAAVTLVGLGTPAVADPVNAPSGSVIDLTCDGTTYQVAVNGNGQWGVATDVGSNKVFIPVWFGEVNGTVTDSEGTVIETFSDPPATKGAGKHADIHCIFADSGTFDDPELGELTFSVSGEVAGFVTPRHH
jgi:hypothetical protein